MLIDVVAPSIASKSGGVGVVVREVCGKLVKMHNEVKIHVKTLGNGLEDTDGAAVDFKHSMYNSLPPKRLGFSPHMLVDAMHTQSDVVHLHGVWMATTAYGNIARKIRKTPIVISPHGMLDPWIMARGKLQKSIAALLFEKNSWGNCSVFHALNQAEAESISRLVPAANIRIIPNGIEVPSFIHREKENFNFLYLGRLHPKKNVHSLITAINSIPDHLYRRKRFKLYIAGWGDLDYTRKLQKLIGDGRKERFEWLGPVFGKEKESIFKSTDSLLLPSFSEGLPMAVLEAWSYGHIVCMSEQCNLVDSIKSGIAFDCGVTPESIKKTIENVLSLSLSEKRSLSRIGYDYCKFNYEWNNVLGEYISMYKSVVNP